MTDERRVAPRRSVNFAAEIETEAGKASVAITRDLSAAGLLVFSRRTLEVGAAVTIKLAHGDQISVIAGKVVRREALTPEESAVWRCKAGVLVDGDDRVLAKLFATLEPDDAQKPAPAETP